MNDLKLTPPPSGREVNQFASSITRGILGFVRTNQSRLCRSHEVLAYSFTPLHDPECGRSSPHLAARCKSTEDLGMVWIIYYAIPLHLSAGSCHWWHVTINLFPQYYSSVHMFYNPRHTGGLKCSISKFQKRSGNSCSLTLFLIF